MSTANLTLHVDSFWVSPYAFSCFLALREKGLPFEIAEVALHHGDQRKPPFRDRSLTAKVPVLEHDGFWLSESMAIVEYLEEMFPSPQFPRVLPLEPRDRGRARQLMSWLRSDLLALREERPTRTMFYPARTEPLSPRAREAADKLLRVAGQLINPGAATLFGSWCLADADLALMLQRLLIAGDEVPERIAAFARLQWSRPSVLQFVEHPRAPFVAH
ncbi:MAG: glutathione transferase [Deltaproteobacteria bacterium]|nr:glutathione transferase [Deltaproteobacteria bacterium]